MAEKVGERLRKAREKAGLSQVELAKRVKASRGAIYNWENDVTAIRNGYVPALAEAFGLHPSDITPFGGHPDNEALARIEEKLDQLLERIERRLSDIA